MDLMAELRKKRGTRPTAERRTSSTLHHRSTYDAIAQGELHASGTQP